MEYREMNGLKGWGFTIKFNRQQEDARAPDDDYYGDDETTHTEAERTLVLPVKQEVKL